MAGKRGRLLYGVAVNDADYAVTWVASNGRRVQCPYYQKWISMVKRCYSSAYQKNKPSYVGCVVCEEWLHFSNFRMWMYAQDWEGLQLDKDLLSGLGGNKIYSPSTCIFVSNEVNALFTQNRSSKGDYLPGVNFHKATGKFIAQICRGSGTSEHIGLFFTQEEAHHAYKIAKNEIIQRVASKQTDVKVTEAVLSNLYII